ncbi:MAG TPA: HAD family hydrolase [Terriglobales bacterium]
MIFFDIDGTLIDHLSASADASLVLYDHFPGEIPFARDTFAETWETIMTKHFNRFCRGEISIWDQRRARMREVFGRPDFSDADADRRYRVFIEAYESQTRAFDDAAPCLEQLKDEPLGIISNGAREQQVGKLERAGLLKYFSVLVFSEDAGLGKPAEAIFREACRRANAQPPQCMHVGDDLVADVAASHALGMTTVWIDRLGIEGCPLPVRRISTLQDLSGAGIEAQNPAPPNPKYFAGVRDLRG